MALRRLGHCLRRGVLWVLLLSHLTVGAEVCPRMWWLSGWNWLEGVPGEIVTNSFESVSPVGSAACKVIGAEFQNIAAPYGPFAILWTVNGMQDVEVWCMRYYERHPYWGRAGWFQVGPLTTMLRYKQPDGRPGGYSDKCNAALTISLEGPSRTKALPPGPVLPQLATVKDGVAPAANRSVSIRIGNGAPITGTTDAKGGFRFTYVPPYMRSAVEDITGTCTGCTNTATKQVTVEQCEVCNGTP